VSDRVQRTASILVGALVVGVIAWIAVSMPTAKTPRIEDASAPTPTETDAASPPSTPDAAPEVTLDASLDLGTDSILLDAGVMPKGAPRSVRLGVVLIQFEGAEGASSAARSKKDALIEAQRLLDEARIDFKKAVHGGDSGSSDDIGRIPRGVLDPRTEIAVFSLGAGDVSDILETPRGYWIVKRLE